MRSQWSVQHLEDSQNMDLYRDQLQYSERYKIKSTNIQTYLLDISCFQLSEKPIAVFEDTIYFFQFKMLFLVLSRYIIYTNALLHQILLLLQLENVLGTFGKPIVLSFPVYSYRTSGFLENCGISLQLVLVICSLSRVIWSKILETQLFLTEKLNKSFIILFSCCRYLSYFRLSFTLE